MNKLNLPIPVATESLSAYINAVNEIPVLSLQEEQKLAHIVQHGTRKEDCILAAQKLVMSHLRFVVHVARGYSGYGLSQGDLIQEGNIGLMKAVKRFDPNKGVRLVSFAVHWIKAEIHEFILKNWRIVKIATTKAQRKLFFNLRRKKTRLGWFSDEEVKAVAKDLGVSTKDVLQMESRLSYQDHAFELSDDNEDDNTLNPSSYLQSETIGPQEALIETDTTERNTASLHKAIATLDERSKDIVTKRWLLDQKSTLQELATEYGVSAERIRQLENNAMKKLKSAMVA